MQNYTDYHKCVIYIFTKYALCAHLVRTRTKFVKKYTPKA